MVFCLKVNLFAQTTSVRWWCLPAVLFSGLGRNLRTLGPPEAEGRTERRTGGSSSPMTPVTSAWVGSPSHGSRTRSASPSDTCHTHKDRGQGVKYSEVKRSGMHGFSSIREGELNLCVGCLMESLKGLSREEALQRF